MCRGEPKRDARSLTDQPTVFQQAKLRCKFYECMDTLGKLR